MVYERQKTQKENPFFNLVKDQEICIIPEFELESGEILRNIPLAYKTWGKLNETKNNALVVCHALTGSADVCDWWGPLLGPGKAFDPAKFFIVCINSLGSPYGSASPCTFNPETGDYFGPEFPLVTVKDDARIQKMLLDDLGINQVAAVVGGSMGGMLVLEYAYFGPQFVRTIIPLATCAAHSAWAISWGEAQRQSIYSDPKYKDGYYKFDDPPVVGLGAARMSAMLTYRSRNSFEAKFGRGKPDVDTTSGPWSPSEQRWAIHNHGHQHGKRLSESSSSSNTPIDGGSPASSVPNSPSASATDLKELGTTRVRRPQTYFTAQSYLRYQGQKFVKRFDANCYIAISRKMDTHDVSRGRADTVEDALELIEQPTLVIGISSDGLFTFTEQERLAQHIPNATLCKINSPEGHDAFLLEFVEINRLMTQFLKDKLSDLVGDSWQATEVSLEDEKGHSSMFGESDDINEATAAVDVTSW
uniref:ARAD1C13332p n=1 Tax=Blastobotrys adeninivorans TaxID=409370 RepID=A0A060T5L0_BLAAD